MYVEFKHLVVPYLLLSISLPSSFPRGMISTRVCDFLCSLEKLVDAEHFGETQTFTESMIAKPHP